MGSPSSLPSPVATRPKEMELGITGGEEDGVNNEDANPEDLYSKPEDHLRDGEGRFRRHAETCFMFGMFKGCYI